MSHFPKAYSEPFQTSNMKCFTKIVNGWKAVIAIFAECSIFDIWQGSKYIFAVSKSDCCEEKKRRKIMSKTFYQQILCTCCGTEVNSLDINFFF